MDEMEVINLKSNNKNNVINNSENKHIKQKQGFFNSIICFCKNFEKSKNSTKVNVGDEKEISNLNDYNSDKKNVNSFTNFFKIKQVKTAVIVLIFCFVALIIVNSSNSSSGKIKSTNSLGYMTCLEYCEQLENRLVEVLGNISGVGNVSVMVSVDSGPEIKIASSTDEKINTTTNSSGSTTTSTLVSDPIIINSSGTNIPLVLSEKSPQILGVVVVASGAKDVKVRLNLLEAVQSLLNVSSDNIQIYY